MHEDGVPLLGSPLVWIRSARVHAVRAWRPTVTLCACWHASCAVLAPSSLCTPSPLLRNTTPSRRSSHRHESVFAGFVNPFLDCTQDTTPYSDGLRDTYATTSYTEPSSWKQMHTTITLLVCVHSRWGMHACKSLFVHSIHARGFLNMSITQTKTRKRYY